MKKIEFNTSVGHLFHSINLKMRRKLERNIKKFNLDSPHQFGILLLLSKQDNITQKRLSDATTGDEGNTTRLISKLIKKELIVKKENPSDKREKLISMLPKGRETLDKITPVAIADNKKIENILTDEEYKNLLISLNKINDFLQ